MVCPEGFDFVQTQAGGACAFRGRAPCLGGHTDWQTGQFVCTAWDFDCPPGTSLRPGSPQNWCFFDAAAPPRVGAIFTEKSSDFVKTVIVGGGVLTLLLIFLGSRAARATSKGFSEQAGRLIAGRVSRGASMPRSYSSYEPKTLPFTRSGTRSRALSFSDFPTYEAYEG